jgi:hypothetical protein
MPNYKTRIEKLEKIVKALRMDMTNAKSQPKQPDPSLMKCPSHGNMCHGVNCVAWDFYMVGYCSLYDTKIVRNRARAELTKEMTQSPSPLKSVKPDNFIGGPFTKAQHDKTMSNLSNITVIRED